MLFYRHQGRVKRVKNQPFGDEHPNIAWNAACDELNVKGLDLFIGTRHTSATEIQNYLVKKRNRSNRARNSQQI